MKALELSDRAAIESVTHRVPCSSDHNFTSLWMWDTDGQTRVSRLGQNLVIQLADYETHVPRTTVIGDDDPEAAIEHVLRSGVGRLDFVPDFIAERLSPERFTIEHDRDQDDYVLDVARMTDFDGPDFAKLRRKAGHCARSLGDQVGGTTIANPQLELAALFDVWARTRSKAEASTLGERAAVERLAADWSALGVTGCAIYSGDVLIAAEVSELVPDGAIAHFMKADSSYSGIFPLLKRETARQLAAAGALELNFEQDLGVPGLRTSKLRYRPIRFVRKYQVCLRP